MSRCPPRLVYISLFSFFESPANSLQKEQNGIQVTGGSETVENGRFLPVLLKCYLTGRNVFSVFEINELVPLFLKSGQ